MPLALAEERAKTVVFFHDESTFHVNKDQPFQWNEKGNCILRPKSKGSGIMVSGFVDERNGYLPPMRSLRKAGKPIQSWNNNLSPPSSMAKAAKATGHQKIQQANGIDIAEVRYPRCPGNIQDERESRRQAESHSRLYGLGKYRK